jgi:hypothetical protein
MIFVMVSHLWDHLSGFLMALSQLWECQLKVSVRDSGQQDFMQTAISKLERPQNFFPTVIGKLSCA